MTPRVLVVDDEPAILDAVAYALSGEGLEVDTRGDGEAALEAARSREYDVLILDLFLPKVPGLEVCRQLRSESDVPILMLTARDAEVDRVLGLEVGADDYVTKPFSMAELIGRVRAILRRRELDRSSGYPIRRVGSLSVDIGRHKVFVGEREVHLTSSEFKLLALLASSPEKVFPRDEIVRTLWESDFAGDGRACDVHVSNLRQKLEDDPSRPQRLVTVRGAGYKLAVV
jgi:DNA-binding response OmpR family regulator